MITVRSAEPRDARAIAEVHVASWRSAYRGIFPDVLLDGLKIEDREERWKGHLLTAPESILICEFEEHVVGFSNYGRSRDPDGDPMQVGELYALYALKEAWNRGCGRALWLETQRRMQAELSVSAVTVWVLTDNLRGRRFYEKAGFLVDGTVKDITLYGETRAETRYRRLLP